MDVDDCIWIKLRIGHHRLPKAARLTNTPYRVGLLLQHLVDDEVSAKIARPNVATRITVRGNFGNAVGGHRAHQAPKLRKGRQVASTAGARSSFSNSLVEGQHAN